MSLHLSVDGIPELETELNRLSSLRLDAVRKKQLTEILGRARAPGGTPVDSGELRLSSSVSGEEMGYAKDYAPHVEYGHRTKNGGYVQGQRFLQDNVETQRDIYRQDLLNQIRGRKG